MTKPNKLLDSLLKPFKSHKKGIENEKKDDLEAIAAQEQKVFSFEALASATRYFHPENKLGEGGFGPVYKGKLDDGREIAVKKLSKSSRQGKREFVNEARLLSRVQHRNVVGLIGYCADEGEKLLIYEYHPNQSLDKILFHTNRRQELDWQKRFDIISGVARGLLYLHQDSHIMIIHRDIKASNILLDQKWKPKIADFGMARLFPEDQTHVNTRVAGTNGYMAPEYMMHGQLSLKVDVFSFGVLVLEIISGQKNSSFDLQADSRGLLNWAWKLWKNGRCSEMVDMALGSFKLVDEQVKMCIQMALLCVQADPAQRPTMANVSQMLARPGTLAEPTRPGYPGVRYGRKRGDRTSSYSKSRSDASSSGDPSSSRTAVAIAATTTTTTTNPSSRSTDVF
ncbi:hypothetical protein AMTRI_Chr04g188080 [Amborella trichopoda]|uniref:Protein kinase domain-containing protein n=1 Tax=Amborella trichopoda TaxID=13333 RepID=W1NFW9_AMBTC|nr:putative receptor-like protein kinase At4g00960 isoform X2 [Amborella trichopoda]ERM94075.1 hypothetical protein AMTR_s00010p00092340 [Amborella trichopoda]|eukprot:XP_006826838.1 putative receptor-like protein kinase At4g00960 isoform X2 [Amborella trichopoda]